MKAFKLMRRLVAIGSLSVISMMAAVSSAAVVVTPSNMQGWSLVTTDEFGNTPGYPGAVAQMVTGPATPPLGVGSAELATAPSHGDASSQIATDQFDGLPLASITSLSYATYDVQNNGQQFPYLKIFLNTNSLTGPATDAIYFEPPYQQPTTGNPTLPDQGATAMNTWQVWDAENGGWWDDNGLANAGTPEPPSTPGVEPLSTFLAAYPAATIAAGGVGGVSLRVGYASPGDNFQGYVDDFTIGVAGLNTTYDFEPNSVPEPASMGLICVGGAAVLMRRRKRAAV